MICSTCLSERERRSSFQTTTASRPRWRASVAAPVNPIVQPTRPPREVRAPNPQREVCTWHPQRISGWSHPSRRWGDEQQPLADGLGVGLPARRLTAVRCGIRLRASRSHLIDNCHAAGARSAELLRRATRAGSHEVEPSSTPRACSNSPRCGSNRCSTARAPTIIEASTRGPRPQTRTMPDSSLHLHNQTVTHRATAGRSIWRLPRQYPLSNRIPNGEEPYFMNVSRDHPEGSCPAALCCRPSNARAFAVPSIPPRWRDTTCSRRRPDCGPSEATHRPTGWGSPCHYASSGILAKACDLTSTRQRR